MKIKKVYLRNFKGVKEKRIIEFENQTSLLIGPNGFGKTTIYDALELCLTNEIHRTVTKEAVTHHRKNYKKPFFQNDENEDVIIKVWLEKWEESESKELIIINYLPKEENKRTYRPGRKHKPDDFYLFQTYKGDSDTFFSDTFNPEDHKKLTSKEINDFFNFDSPDVKIEDIYNLFNYLQQEETMFFLKQSERARKDSLSFLFNTNQVEKESQRISEVLRNLRNISKKLNKKIETYEISQETNAIEYITLFPSQNKEFDKEALFWNKDLEISLKERDEYLNEIKKLIEFINRFEPVEYHKKENIYFINAKINNDKFINYYVLHKLIKTNRFNSLKKIYELKNNEMKLKAYILQHHINKYEEYKMRNIKFI